MLELLWRWRRFPAAAHAGDAGSTQLHGWTGPVACRRSSVEARGRITSCNAQEPSMSDPGTAATGPQLDAQMLQAALQTAVGAIVIIDEEGIIRSVNPAIEEMFGFSEAELIGRNVSVLMPEPFRSRHDSYIRRHLETGEKRIIGIGRQVMALRKSGAIFPAHLSVSAFEAEGRRYFTGIIHDVSEQRETEVLREQALLHAIFLQLPDALLIVDPHDTITLCNPAVLRVFGYPPEELIGKPAEILYQSRDEYRRLHEMSRAWRQAEPPEPVTMGLVRKSGERFPAEAVISVLRDQNGQFVGFMSLNRDISQQVIQDEALRKSQRMEAIGQLTGGIAHDFNNLLTIITGNHELLEMELHTDEQRDLLARANSAALMGARLTSRLLTFARRRRLEPVVLDLNDQVLSMAELLRRTLGETIALATLLSPRLWPVQADPSEIENAVLNLAINARDAMPAGGKLLLETKNVVLAERDVAREVGVQPGDYVRLSVSDTGVGMSPEVLARVFEPFFTTKEHGKGTGLGLSVIYGFVKQSGGHVTVYSEVGKGTTVNVYLPRVVTAAAPSTANGRERAMARDASETILVVEDNAEVRQVSARRVGNLGYSVIEAESAARAIEVLESGAKVDLIFSDVVMPGGMSGFDLAAWARKNVPSVRVLLTSGFADDVARAGETAAQGLEILRKPYTADELARALRAALDGT
jgi:PAS domain S-box-containing protein